MWAYRTHCITKLWENQVRCHESSPGFKPRANRRTRADALQNHAVNVAMNGFPMKSYETVCLEIPHCRFLSWYQPKVWWGGNAKVSWKINSERQCRKHPESWIKILNKNMSKQIEVTLGIAALSLLSLFDQSVDVLGSTNTLWPHAFGSLSAALPMARLPQFTNSTCWPGL